MMGFPIFRLVQTTSLTPTRPAFVALPCGMFCFFLNLKAAQTYHVDKSLKECFFFTSPPQIRPIAGRLLEPSGEGVIFWDGVIFFPDPGSK